MSNEIFELIPEDLRGLLQVLNSTAATDPEDLVREHAKIAIQELNAVVVQFLRS